MLKGISNCHTICAFEKFLSAARWGVGIKLSESNPLSLQHEYFITMFASVSKYAAKRQLFIIKSCVQYSQILQISYKTTYANSIVLVTRLIALSKSWSRHPRHRCINWVYPGALIIRRAVTGRAEIKDGWPVYCINPGRLVRSTCTAHHNPIHNHPNILSQTVAETKYFSILFTLSL